MTPSRIKEPLSRLLSKDFLKFYWAWIFGISWILILGLLIDRGGLEVSQILTLLLAIHLFGLVIFIIFAFFYVFIIYDHSSSSSVELPKNPTWLNKLVEIGCEILALPFRFSFWLLRWAITLALIGISLYAVYFILGGILGLLKFGWKNM